MEIVAGNLSAHYKGRGESFLHLYNRIVIHKDDGSVCIHGDAGYKPLNYMMAPTTKSESYVEDKLTWTITGRNEVLTITFEEIFNTFKLDLGNEDPGLKRISTEDHLQEWLQKHAEFFGNEVNQAHREYQTGRGPIDLFLEQQDGSCLAVEVKRVAALNTVGQVLRYTDALEEKFPGRHIDGIIAALEFKQSVLELAEKKKIACLLIPEDWATTPTGIKVPIGVRVTAA